LWALHVAKQMTEFHFDGLTIVGQSAQATRATPMERLNPAKSVLSLIAIHPEQRHALINFAQEMGPGELLPRGPRGDQIYMEIAQGEHAHGLPHGRRCVTVKPAPIVYKDHLRQ